MSFLLNVWTPSICLHSWTVMREKTRNIFNSTSTDQHGVPLPTERPATWCSLQRVNYISLFFSPELLMTLQASQQFSTKAPGVTLACCDRSTQSHEVYPVLKMPGRRTAEVSGIQRQRPCSLRQTRDSESSVSGASFPLRHGVKVAGTKWQQDLWEQPSLCSSSASLQSWRQQQYRAGMKKAKPWIGTWMKCEDWCLQVESQRIWGQVAHSKVPKESSTLPLPFKKRGN